MIYINKIENAITFKIKSGYYLVILIPAIMKLLSSTKSKINKDKNGENMLHYTIQESCIQMFLINYLVNY